MSFAKACLPRVLLPYLPATRALQMSLQHDFECLLEFIKPLCFTVLLKIGFLYSVPQVTTRGCLRHFYVSGNDGICLSNF